MEFPFLFGLVLYMVLRVGGAFGLATSGATAPTSAAYGFRVFAIAVAVSVACLGVWGLVCRRSWARWLAVAVFAAVVVFVAMAPRPVSREFGWVRVVTARLVLALPFLACLLWLARTAHFDAAALTGNCSGSASGGAEQD